MSVKPVSVAAALGGPDQPRETGKNPPLSNRFALLRDRSRSLSTSGSGPPLSPAVKRRSDNGPDPSRGKTPRLDNNSIFAAMESVEKKLEKGKKGLDALKGFLAKTDTGVEGALKEFLGGVVDSLDNVFDSLTEVASTLVDKGAAPTPVKVRGREAVKVLATGAGTGTGSGAVAATAAHPPLPTQEEVRKKKFVAAVKDAEKAVLVFNLNLGRVPVMNTGTIAKKVTEDITAKAAAVEGKENGRPSEDTITVLEDTLSVMKGMEFFGKATKLYTNKNNAADQQNGKYCTLPVKMVFRDRESKARAEAVLRKSCKLQCSTPYPTQLRKVIKNTIEVYRGKFPENFIQVKVDPERLQLKLSRRPKADNARWINDFEVVKLEDDVLDLGSVSNRQVDMDTEQEGAGAL